MRTIKQGGISNEVWGSKNLQEYVNSEIVAGYVGSSTRTIKSDAILETILTLKGMNYEEIGLWMTHSTGRHMCDHFSKGMSARELALVINNYTSNAKEDILQ
jgi:hypothetical protein